MDGKLIDLGNGLHLDPKADISMTRTAFGDGGREVTHSAVRVGGNSITVGEAVFEAIRGAINSKTAFRMADPGRVSEFASRGRKPEGWPDRVFVVPVHKAGSGAWSFAVVRSKPYDCSPITEGHMWISEGTLCYSPPACGPMAAADAAIQLLSSLGYEVAP